MRRPGSSRPCSAPQSCSGAAACAGQVAGGAEDGQPSRSRRGVASRGRFGRAVGPSPNTECCVAGMVSAGNPISARVKAGIPFPPLVSRPPAIIPLHFFHSISSSIPFHSISFLSIHSIHHPFFPSIHHSIHSSICHSSTIRYRAAWRGRDVAAHRLSSCRWLGERTGPRPRCSAPARSSSPLAGDAGSRKVRRLPGSTSAEVMRGRLKMVIADGCYVDGREDPHRVRTAAGRPVPVDGGHVSTQRRVVRVTGMGIASCLGNDLDTVSARIARRARGSITSCRMRRARPAQPGRRRGRARPRAAIDRKLQRFMNDAAALATWRCATRSPMRGWTKRQ